MSLIIGPGLILAVIYWLQIFKEPCSPLKPGLAGNKCGS